MVPVVVARIVPCAASISVARLESRGPPGSSYSSGEMKSSSHGARLAQVSPRDPASTRRAWRLVTLRRLACPSAASIARHNCSILRSFAAQAAALRAAAASRAAALRSRSAQASAAVINY